METAEILRKLTSISGVSGAEHPASEVVAKMISEYTDNLMIDHMGNVIAIIKKGTPCILLDAHIDRIGLIVTEVCEEGFLRVAPCGGVDKRTLSAQSVSIHTKTGDISGVVTAMPPHLQSAEEMKKNIDIDKVFIDTGLTKTQAEIKISLGDRITLITPEINMLNGRFCAGAVDDRAGITAIIKTAEILADKQYNCGVSILFSAQEETGERGAIAMSHAINYDEVIAVDVSFAYTPDAKRHKCGMMGEGVMIGIAPSLNKDVSKRLINICKNNNIKYQLEVMSGETGTNADALGVGNGGAKTGLLSIPIKYMHTPVEMVDISDIDCVSKTLAEYILKVGGQCD